MNSLIARRAGLLLGWLCLLAVSAHASDANRLTYLDETDPFYVNLQFPKLTTPQWIGEPGVEAVVILAIDDMKLPGPYETMLGPILDRLKQIDGRAPISILCNELDPQEPQYQKWLAEGLSLEVHTLTHPCPILGRTHYQGAAERRLIEQHPELAATLGRTNFQGAAATYNGGVELINRIPGNHAVAFRTPCCDSIDSPSPRLFAELFNQTTPSGQFLTIDSSIMNIPTPQDPGLPREWLMDADGKEKFRKYLPFPAFTTTVENYSYPYVIGRLGWEFPCVVPSDWEAFHLHGATNAITVADWKSALDATVLKQGVFTMIFHPHGWIRNDQIVELIDYSVKKYGPKVKFLNFREAQERLDKNLLAGQPLRAANGQDNGVRLLDLNNDGYLDVVIGNEHVQKTRIWNPKDQAWIETSFPTPLALPDATGQRHDTGVRFGVIAKSGLPIMLVRNESTNGAWRFDGQAWVAESSLWNGLELDSQPIFTSQHNRDRGVRLRDINRDGICELIVGNESQNAIFSWSEEAHSWKRLEYSLPEETSVVDADGNDNGLRFVDVNEDGFDDVIFSNAKQYSLHLFIPQWVLGWSPGWTRLVMAGKRGDPGEIPMIVRDGEHQNNGAWFRERTMWVQNEDTAAMPDLVDRRTFKELLAGGLTPAKSPAESLAAIHVRPGFKVELVASEPLVKDPIAFEWGADGKLWVVEMGDYPLGLDGKGKPGGTILFLEDTHGDGHYDKSTTFLSGVNFPNGIIPWGKGVIVSAPPEIFYAEDTDGDGKADKRVTLFTGFNEGNQQHRANGFDYGLDNWLYGANGDSGGTIRSILTGKSVNISGRDFRFRPDDGAFETQAGQAQYGRHRDDWGNWFGNENAEGAWHYFLPEQYLARNPQLAVRTSKQVMPNYDDYSRVFPTSRLAQRFNDPQGANHLTSANSAMPYRDDLFGPEFATSYFVSEPVHNLVHREIMEPDGVTFTSHRAADEKDSEFFSSSDNWCRPTMTKTGPDGALYIADMYRQIIEHPQWIPLDAQKIIDLRAGSEQGRIYRVYPTNATLRAIPRLDKLDAAGLVTAMESPNGWQRDAAQRLLVQAQDKSAIMPLENLLAHSSHPKTRLQALCTLDGLHGLRPEIVKQALHDSDPHVRENAIRVSESLLAKSDEVGEALLGLIHDPDLRVRYQLAFSLGEWANPRAGQALGELARNDASDANIQTAVMSSATHHLGDMIAAVLDPAQPQPPPGDLLERLIGTATALDDQPALAKALQALLPANRSQFDSWQFGAVGGLLDALERRSLTLAQFQAGSSAELKPLLLRLEALFIHVRKTAADMEIPEVERVAAIRVLGRGITTKDADLQELGELLSPKNPQAIQAAAMENLKRARGSQVPAIFMASWKDGEPAIRAQIVEALMSRKDWIPSLLGAMEKGLIPTRALGTPQQQSLANSPKAAIRDRAIKLFAAAKSDRQSILDRYQIVNELKGNPQKGAEIFRQNCIPCHRLKGEGNEVGPDLGSVASRPAGYLLTAILDPNQSVEVRYTGYSVTTRNDLEYSGIIAAETANSITLRLAGGKDVQILRSEIKDLTSTGRTLMPDGFENVLNPQALADLIAHIHLPAK